MVELNQKMNSNFREHKLKSEAFKYLKEINRNRSTLVHLIFNHANNKTWECITYLPVEKNKIAFSDIKYGIKGLTSTIPQNWLVSKIIKQVSANNNNICIFEDTIITPKDISSEVESANKIFYNQEVYYFISNNNLSSELIKKTLLYAMNDYPGRIGLISSLEDITLLTDKAYLEEETIKKIVKNTEMFFIEAFDGESFLVWSKK